MPVTRQPSRRYINYLAYTVIAITLLLLLLPQVVGRGLIYGLGRISHGAVSVENVDINLFTGRLALDELQLYQSGARVFRLGHGEIELDWHALWRKRIQLAALKLQNMSVTVEQPSKGSLRIAGFPLPATDNAAAATDEGQSTPWGFGLDKVSLKNIDVDLIRPGLAQSVSFTRLHTESLHSWEQDAVTPLNAELAMSGATLKVDGSTRPFAQQPSATLKLQLSSLDLASLHSLLPANAPRLKGKLFATLQLQGRLNGEQIHLQQSGSLSGKTIAVPLPANHLVLSSGNIDWQGKSDLTLRQGKMQLNTSGNLALANITAASEGTDTVHTRLAQLQLNTIQLHGLQDIHIGEIQLAGLQTSLRLTPQGLEPVQSHLASADRQSTSATANSDTPATRLRVDTIRLGGDNRIQFEDTTTRPAFKQSVTAIEMALGAIDSEAPQQAAPFSLKAKLGEHSLLSGKGEVMAFAQPLNIRINTQLSEFEMPPLSPYLVRQLGYRINSGQLDSELQLAIANNAMKGEVRLKARQLEMEPEDPARIEKFEQQSNMPINTALGLLRDKENNIRLKVPLSGNLADPQFDFSDAINTALANTMRSAAVSYLKYLLQPYSSVISLVQLAGKAGGGVQLEPIAFPAGKLEPEPQTEGYIAKLAELFRTRKNLQLRLCGIATTSDLLSISKGERKVIPPEGDEQLESLARGRAENIKNIMVDRYGVSAAQLFICHPGLDRAEDAVPRIRLQL